MVWDGGNSANYLAEAVVGKPQIDNIAAMGDEEWGDFGGDSANFAPDFDVAWVSFSLAVVPRHRHVAAYAASVEVPVSVAVAWGE